MPRNREEADLFFCSVTPLQKCETRTKTLAEIEDEVRALLRPLMGDRDSRRARLARAFAKYPGLLDRIGVDGETAVFLDLLLNTLRGYGEVEEGKPATYALLESIRSEVGVGERKRIDSIIRRPGNESKPVGPQLDPTQPPSQSAQVIAMSQYPLTTVAPTVGILTALDHEFVAMKAMLDQPRDYDVPVADVRYVLGEVPGSSGGVHQVVLALGDMGESLAAIHGRRCVGVHRCSCGYPPSPRGGPALWETLKVATFAIPQSHSVDCKAERVRPGRCGNDTPIVPSASWRRSKTVTRNGRRTSPRRRGTSRLTAGTSGVRCCASKTPVGISRLYLCAARRHTPEL